MRSNCWLIYLQLLSFATEELSKRVGQTLAGLINATLVSLLSVYYFRDRFTKVQSRDLTGKRVSELRLRIDTFVY